MKLQKCFLKFIVGRPSTGNGRNTIMDVEDAEEEEVSNSRAGPGGSRAEALQKQRDIQLKKRQASLNAGGLLKLHISLQKYV